MTFKLFVLIGSITLVSCATQKKDESLKELNKVGIDRELIKGKSSKSDVIKLLGSPELVHSNSEGEEQWVYSKSETEWKSKYGNIGTGILTFISSSLLDGFVNIGGGNSTKERKMKTLEVYFSKKGFLKSYEFSFSKI